MSNRTIIEINHDFAHDIEGHIDEFEELLFDYLRACSKPSAERLKQRFGFNIIGTAHHSDSRKVIIAGEETEL